MKKFLLSMLLILMGAMWSSVDARWIIGDRKNASQIKVGDTVVIEQSSRAAYLGYYIQTANSAKGVELLNGTGVGDAAIIVVEEGPLDIRTNEPTVYLKMVSNGKYLGQNTSWDNGCGLATDPAKAANFQILSCSEDIPWSNTYGWDDFQEGVYRDDATYTEKDVPNWRSNTNEGGRGSDDNSVGFCWSQDDSNFKYLSFWSTKEPAVLLWNYTDTNQWNVYSVTYEKSLQDDLQEVIDVYTGDGSEFIAGNDPGYYGAEAVDAYNAALEAALMASVSSDLTDEEYQKAIDDLVSARIAVENALITIEEGYYFLVSGFDDFLNNFGVEKAAYIDAAGPSLKYKTFDADDLRFVFHITPNDVQDEFWVQSYANGLYVAKGTVWYNSPPAITEDPEEPQNIRAYVPGKWYWGSRTYHNTSYTPYASSSPQAKDGEGNLTTWGQWKDDSTVNTHFNLWYIRKISDEQMTAFADKKAQADRDAELKALVADANNLYDKLFVYEPDLSTKLITTVSGGANEEPAEDNQLTFSTIRRQGVAFADKYEFLIDDDDTTYMQGSGYMTIKLKEPKQVITFVYNTRDASGHGTNANWQKWGAQERPKLINFYGANTLAGDTVYGNPVASDINMADLPLPATYTLDFGRPVNRVAYQVTLNANGGTYFTISEFQMYEAKANEEKSQYYSAEGMKEKADALKALAAAKRAVADSSLTTADDIAQLQAAIDAVDALYADTTKLLELVDRAQLLADNTEVGDEVGQVSDENAPATLQAAITAAKALGLKADATKAELDQAIADLNQAVDAFMASLNTFEEGKWYFIVSGDQRETSTVAGKALYMSGYADNSPAKVGKVTDGYFEYTYDPYSMWRFVAAEDGGYAVQNMGTGFYLSAATGKGGNVQQSYEPVSYTVDFVGNTAYTFTPNVANSHALAVTANGESAVFAAPGVADSTTWMLLEIDPAATEYITIKDFKLNAMDIFALPYDVSMLAELNEENDCHIYGIKSMTYNEETDETTIEFYEKSELAANEPAFFKFGNLDNDYEDFELLLPFPTEVVDKLVPANGIYGMLHPESIEEGIAYASGKDLVLAGEGGTGISAHTGAIDPKYYKGEVADAETALTLTIKGLKWPEPSAAGDVDGDGKVNTSDVVAVYSYIIDGDDSGITKAAADVDGDGNVTTADVVAIYDIIINGSAAGSGSNGFYPTDEGQAEMSAFVGSSDDLTKVPVTITLAIPEGKEITAFEASLEIFAAPEGVVADESVEGSVQKFLFNGRRAVVEDTDRWTEDHSGTYSKGTKEHGANSMFISIVNQYLDPFTGSEGPIITVFFDASELAEGNYVVRAFDLLAVGTDKSSQTSPDVDAKFTVKDSRVTAVTAITAEEFAAAKAVYTLDGKKVAAPQKGQIYVVDGKTVKY